MRGPRCLPRNRWHSEVHQETAKERSLDRTPSRVGRTHDHRFADGAASTSKFVVAPLTTSRAPQCRGDNIYYGSVLPESHTAGQSLRVFKRNLFPRGRTVSPDPPETRYPKLPPSLINPTKWYPPQSRQRRVGSRCPTAIRRGPAWVEGHKSVYPYPAACDGFSLWEASTFAPAPGPTSSPTTSHPEWFDSEARAEAVYPRAGTPMPMPAVRQPPSQHTFLYAHSSCL